MTSFRPSCSASRRLHGSTPQRPWSAPEARSAWFEKGLSAYAAGEHFDAHEFWEEIWRDAPQGPHREFLQGLIQVAAAMHKAMAQQKPAPASRLLARALLRLRDAPPHHMGLQVDRLRSEAERARTILAAGKMLDAALIPTIARACHAQFDKLSACLEKQQHVRSR